MSKTCKKCGCTLDSNSDDLCSACICPQCDGTGQVGPDGASWKAWLDLPPGSNIAVMLGLVQPEPCPLCGGNEEDKQGTNE